MKRILLITVRADFGGGPKHVDQLIDGLHEDFTLFVACPKEEPFGNKWYNESKISDFFELPHRKFSFLSLWKLGVFINKNKIDIIHSHGKGAGIYSRLLKVFRPIVKVVHTFHGISANYGLVFNRLYLIFESFLSLFTARFIYVSNGEANKSKNMGLFNLSKSSVIYNGISDRHISKEKHDNTFNIICISRFDYAKHMDFAYSIAKRFKNDKAIKFIWVGDGEEKLRLQELALQEDLNIEFIGFVSDPFPYLQNSDVLLSTSRFEGMPYALIEASSIGIPIIATDVVGNNEIVEDGVNGYLFRDVDEAVECIIALSHDVTLTEQLGARAKEYFLQKYSLEQLLSKLKMEYKFLLK